MQHDYTYAMYWVILQYNEAMEALDPMSQLVSTLPKPTTPISVQQIFEQSSLNSYTFGLVEYNWCLLPSGKCKLLMLNTADQQRVQTRQEIMAQVSLGERRVNPYLVLRVRRDELIPDTLQRLASVPPDGFRKQLKIVFEGEQGQDEGGVQKEFFQLLIQELYDPQFTMFCYNPETKWYWFNVSSLESPLNFELFGALLGMAIYNRVILDVLFKGVVFKQILNRETHLELLSLFMRNF